AQACREDAACRSRTDDDVVEFVRHGRSLSVRYATGREPSNAAHPVRPADERNARFDLNAILGSGSRGSGRRRVHAPGEGTTLAALEGLGAPREEAPRLEQRT
ncbi:MAG TPA: hypothetical protein VFF72_09410, partial [Caldimonas sp.]|nr:hypothetical protein [Caldimonas sp.]